MNKVLLLFVDGVGIGKKDYEFNPFFKYGFETFTKIFGATPHIDEQFFNKNDYYLFPTDARLGIEGLPQSGTGQTSIFCGVNAPKIINKHFGPFPYSTLVPIIEQQNIFKYYLDKLKPVTFTNAYPKVFFDYINAGKKRLSVTTLSCRLNNMRLNNATDLRRGRAIAAELTNEIWNKKLNYKIKIVKPETAARRLLRIADKHVFTAFEFFLTDHLGHGRYDGNAQKVMKNLDMFLLTLLTEFDRKNTTIILCSDHGNFEDLSIKTHTLNPALTIAAGRNAKRVFESVQDITQIKNSIIELTE